MRRIHLQLAIIGFVAILCAAPEVSAQSAPPLGAAQGFAVLAGTSVTNTGATVVTGDLGVSPGTSVVGFGPGVVVAGSIHSDDAAAMAAQVSLTTAYNNLAGQACTTNLTGQDLGGLVLTPGVYCFDSSAQLTGLLTLDAQGNANAVFVIQIATTLTTASTSSVVVTSPGSPCNVFWQVGTSATLGTGTSFAGSILAQASITLNSGAQVMGRVLARDGAVTLATSPVTVTCPTPPAPACPTITLSPSTLPGGTEAVAYSQTITGSDGEAPYSFAVTSGTLPTGVTLTAAGVLVGTPTVAGTYTFTIRGTDANACFASRSYTIIIAAAPPPPAVCPTIALSPATLPNGTELIAYSQTIVGSDGEAPYSFAVTSGTLPTGVTLTAAGVLAGTPTVAGTYTFTIRGTDDNACFASRSYTIIIAAAPPPPAVCPTIALSPATLPDGTELIAYSQTIVGSGGTSPYSFGVTSGALPAGVTLAADGELTGTPTVAGTYTFTIRGTDANACFAARSYTIVVAAAPLPPAVCPTITLSPTTLPNGTLLIAYSQTIAGSGGTASYSFGVTSGALPSGLTLTAAGLLSGTPTTAGPFTFTVRGADANACFATRSYTMAVPLAVPALPQALVVLLGLGLTACGYLRLRRIR